MYYYSAPSNETKYGVKMVPCAIILVKYSWHSTLACLSIIERTHGRQAPEIARVRQHNDLVPISSQALDLLRLNENT